MDKPKDSTVGAATVEAARVALDAQVREMPGLVGITISLESISDLANSGAADDYRGSDDRWLHAVGG
jgi:hypothetical protein